MKTEFDLLHDKMVFDFLDLYPTTASYLGLKKYNDRCEISISKTHILKEEKLVNKYLADLKKVKKEIKDEKQKINCLACLLILEDMKNVIDNELSVRSKTSRKLNMVPHSLLPLNQMDSPIQFLIDILNQDYYKITTNSDFKDLISKIKEFNKWFEVAIENMRLGMKNKIVLPKVIADEVLKQLLCYRKDKSYLKLIEKSKKVNDSLLNKLKNLYEKEFLKELELFIDFFKNEYLNNCRDSISINEIVNNNIYQKMIKSYDINLDANKIHEIGIKEVNRINNLIKKITKKLNFNGTVDEFHEKMKKDKNNLYKRGTELKSDILKYKKLFDKEVVKKQFNIFPSSDYVIKKFNEDIAENLPCGSYLLGTIFGPKRKGIFYYNSIVMPPRYDVPSLVLHEGNPGHHFQGTISQDSKKIDFITMFNPSKIITYNEGWGLYVEGLYDYDDLILEYGKLNSELFRAVRLVVDTGIHEKKWSREKTVNYMKNNLGHGDGEIESEVNRYIVDPGQALCYKIGQMEILRLKKEFLKKNNDVKEFHKKFIENGEIPLSLLKKYF